MRLNGIFGFWVAESLSPYGKQTLEEEFQSARQDLSPNSVRLLVKRWKVRRHFADLKLLLLYLEGPVFCALEDFEEK